MDLQEWQFMEEEGVEASEPMGEHIANARSEFQVVLLAGGCGQHVYNLTGNKPKCMLPVANQPLLSYQFALLSKAGFSEVIVVTTKEHKDCIVAFVDGWKEAHASEWSAMPVDIAVVEDDIGSADALREIKDRIRGDFIVTSGDLIMEVRPAAAC
jgi:translation initiation factor eIF-2B subunit gamma